MTSSSSNTSLTLAGCFLAGVTSAVVVGSLFGRRGKKSGSSVAFSDNKTSSTCTKVPEELRREQLSRHGLYFGNEGLNLIRSSNVCVVGLGGVGSHCALMLARGGVERLRLIDFDQVTLSSLNRHACATLKDVGISKVECVKNTCMELGLAPEHIDARVEMYTKETGPDLLSLATMPKKEGDTIGENQKWDVVIDCIDDVPTKAALLTYCIRNKIRVLSCMGAGGKSDMTRLHISDLRTSAKDPLASKLRQTIKKTMKQFDADRKEGNGDKDSASGVDDSYLDDMDQLTIIFSSEKTVAKLADLTEEQKTEADKSQFGAVDGMRIRVLPVLGPMPAIMGQSLAAITLCELGKKQIQNPVTGERIGRNIRHKIFQQYGSREKKIASGDLKIAGGASYTGPIEIDSDDVEYLYGVWRNRCAVTSAKIGAVLGLVRWDTSKPATADNLVLMSRPAQQRYDEKGKSSIDPKVRARIEQRLAACRDVSYDM
mmetsp:Transcript_25748/g.60653  ORF Transcript_25748/g.60653 Transcript_25748/m.60653 type:complete len:486 (+) Transcript_25748:143-1600(+)